MKYFEDIDEFNNAINLIIAHTPQRIPAPLIQNGKKTYPTFKPYTSEMIRQDLLKLPAEELKERFELAKIKQVAYQQAAEKKMFFNRPPAEVDLEYWCKMPYWTIDEAIILLLLKNPDVVNADSLHPYLSNPARYELVMQYSNIKRIALRAKTTGDLTDPVRPVTFVMWAFAHDIFVPKSLSSTLGKHVKKLLNFNQMKDQLSSPPEKLSTPIPQGKQTSDKERKKMFQEETNKIVKENPTWTKPSVIEELFDRLKRNHPHLIKKKNGIDMKLGTLTRMVTIPKTTR